ncbi:MAG: hypothetical protein RLZ37_139 [Actinomycetota bacterium]
MGSCLIVNCLIVNCLIVNSSSEFSSSAVLPRGQARDPRGSWLVARGSCGLGARRTTSLGSGSLERRRAHDWRQDEEDGPWPVCVREELPL